jgi:hypothetical protein
MNPGCTGAQARGGADGQQQAPQLLLCRRVAAVACVFWKRTPQVDVHLVTHSLDQWGKN